ncbi:zinc finger BED domain-containing protein 4-like [Vanessa cardui]|uniref:zinc finger BED domain-containing protein 4-like n=1 Tax=Vanessa cardui TaxID=171605 RepID=UPI001F132348|nr:zinc finger BED domain-containing protein 4-like [Vanessa cardui]
MPPPKQSDIWNYFKPNEHERDKADCKICDKTYSRKGRTTSSLRSHLKSMHPEELRSFESSSKKKQLPMENTDADKIAILLLEAKRRLSLEEVVLKEEKWDTNDHNAEKIDKLIGEMIALQTIPFNFVEGMGFRRLIQELAPRYKLRGRNFFTDFVCKDLYSKVAENVKELINKFNYLSFTSNIWSDPSSNVSFLSLTCHAIAENFDRSSIILKCDTFDGRHTGDIIFENFNSMLSEWNIEKDRVHCLIRDEGCNMKNVCRLALNDIDCAVHKMQLTIDCSLDSQESIKLVIQKCKKISTHFNHSTIAQKQLQAIQDRLNQPHLKVFQDCITRWNSTFYMFERFLKVKDALSLYINNDSKFSPILPEEWKIIESCIELLIPFEEATRELSSSHALISSVIPIIQMLNKKVEDLARSENFEPIQQAVRTLKTELITKFSNLSDNNLYVIATYLDPRYKHKFLTPVIEVKIREDILKIGKNIDFNDSDSFNFGRVKRIRMSVSSENDLEQPEPGPSGLVRKSCLKYELAMMLDSSSDDDSELIGENVSVETILKRELLSYRNKKRVNVYENPLKWWSVNREELKLLSEIARRFLSTPPGSVPSEQLFSTCSGLDPEKAAILLFIKYNAPIFNFCY